MFGVDNAMELVDVCGVSVMRSRQIRFFWASAKSTAAKFA